MFKPISLKYLVQYACGFSNSCLFELEKRTKNILSSLMKTLLIQKMNIFVMPSMNKDGNGDHLFYQLVIDFYNTAEKKTPTTCML